MNNNSHGAEQLANSADSKGSAAPDSPGSVRPSIRELRDRAVFITRIATAHIASRRVGLGSGGVLTGSETKLSAVDPVTVIDHESEELIRSLIKAFSSSDRILGEEGGLDDGAGSQAQTTDAPKLVTWIINPIDGTVGFLYGLPNFAVSIACAIDDKVAAGTVANVYSGEICCVTKGEGAQVSRRDGIMQALNRSPTTELEETFVATGLNYSANLRRIQSRITSQSLRKRRGIRHMGSAALNLCMVVHDRADAYYEHDTKIQGYAAGVLIAAEAGARVRIPEFSECANAAGRSEGNPLNFGAGTANPEVVGAFHEALDGAISKTRSQCVGLGAGV